VLRRARGHRIRNRRATHDELFRRGRRRGRRTTGERRDGDYRQHGSNVHRAPRPPVLVEGWSRAHDPAHNRLRTHSLVGPPPRAGDQWSYRRVLRATDAPRHAGPARLRACGSSLPSSCPPSPPSRSGASEISRRRVRGRGSHAPSW
jgi:hypothetical protein